MLKKVDISDFQNVSYCDILPDEIQTTLNERQSWPEFKTFFRAIPFTHQIQSRLSFQRNIRQTIKRFSMDRSWSNNLRQPLRIPNKQPNRPTPSFA